MFRNASRCFPLLQHLHHITEFPELRCDACRHRGRASDGLVNADEVVMHEIGRKGEEPRKTDERAAPFFFSVALRGPPPFLRVESLRRCETTPAAPGSTHRVYSTKCDCPEVDGDGRRPAIEGRRPGRPCAVHQPAAAGSLARPNAAFDARGRRYTFRNLCNERRLSGRGLSGQVCGQLVHDTSPTYRSPCESTVNPCGARNSVGPMPGPSPPNRAIRFPV
jgi:hypothetical protein